MGKERKGVRLVEETVSRRRQERKRPAFVTGMRKLAELSIDGVDIKPELLSPARTREVKEILGPEGVLALYRLHLGYNLTHDMAFVVYTSKTSTDGPGNFTMHVAPYRRGEKAANAAGFAN